jgi:hypothetical protein
MACCGSRRASLRHEREKPPAQATSSGESVFARWGSVDFEYLGRGQMTVTGPLTRNTYHFATGGAPVRVDGRDVPSLVSVPGLRSLR